MPPPSKKRRAERRAADRAAATTTSGRVRRPGAAPLPEDAGDADGHYNDAEAGRYSAQNAGVQADLAAACLRFMGLDGSGAPPTTRLLLLDAGCGSGLSTAAAAAAGHAVVGCDLSAAMLGRAVSAAPAARGLVWRGDLGQAPPLRPGGGLFDGALSVSAIQWLAPSSCSGGTARLDAFFGGLAAALVPGAGAVLQFYPRSDGDALAVLAAARGAGLDASALFADVPHAKGGARKTFVGAIKGRERGAAVAGWSPPPAADCPICWPRAGTCGLWWARVGAPLLRRGQGGGGGGGGGSGGGGGGGGGGGNSGAAAAPADPLTRAHALLSAAAPRLVGEHRAAGSRLARVARRALGQVGEVSLPRARLEAWVAGPDGQWAPCGAPLLVSVAGPTAACFECGGAAAPEPGRAPDGVAQAAVAALIAPAFPGQAVGGGAALVEVVATAVAGAPPPPPSAVRAVPLGDAAAAAAGSPATHLLLADGCARYVLARWPGVAVPTPAAGVAAGATRAAAAAAALGARTGRGGVYALLVDLGVEDSGFTATITLAVHARNADGDEGAVAGLAERVRRVG